MARKRILVLANLPGDGLARLRAQCEVDVVPNLATRGELVERIPGYDGLLPLLTHRVDQEVFGAADRLRVVANFAVGVDNIDLAAAQEHGVMVTHTPHVLTDDTADLTWALILAVSRRIPPADRFVRSGEFTGWRPDLFLGRSLSGLTLGVVGAGRIGCAVLERAPAFKVQTVYHSRRRLPLPVEAELATRFLPLSELLETSDIISFHLPLNAQTHHLLGRDAMSLMKNSAVVINTARGAIIDEGALVDALESGRLGGAGLDVFEQEPRLHPGLESLENVVLLPHVGSATSGTRIMMADACCEDLLDVLVRGERPERDLTPLTL